MWADRQSLWLNEPSEEDEKAHERWNLSRDYIEAVEHAEAASHRAVELARGLEIPPAGCADSAPQRSEDARTGIVRAELRSLP